jgi:hypothetical protein
MDQAKRVEILLADEVNPRMIYRRCGSRIIAAIKNRELCNRAAGAVHCQYLLAAARRTFKDAHVALFYNKEAGAHLAFSEDQLAGRIFARDCSLRKELEFGGREIRKNSNPAQCFQRLWFRAVHHTLILPSEYFLAARGEAPASLRAEYAAQATTNTKPESTTWVHVERLVCKHLSGPLPL